jgi:hypothetical protein
VTGEKARRGRRHPRVLRAGEPRLDRDPLAGGQPAQRRGAERLPSSSADAKRCSGSLARRARRSRRARAGTRGRGRAPGRARARATAPQWSR